MLPEIVGLRSLINFENGTIDFLRCDFLFVLNNDVLKMALFSKRLMMNNSLTVKPELEVTQDD